MTNQNIRLFLIAALIAVGMLLYQNWELEHAKTRAPSNQTSLESVKETNVPENTEIPQTLSANEQSASAPHTSLTNEAVEYALPEDRRVHVKTDVLDVTIDTLGGDIIRLGLPKYADERIPDEKQEYLLFDYSKKLYYIAQSGLAGEAGPDSRRLGRAKYTSDQSSYEIPYGQDSLKVDLKVRTEQNVDIIKRFTFHRGSYVIDVEYLIFNQGTKDYTASFYTRLKQRAAEESKSSFFGVQTFTGAAVNTKETPYKKLSFKDLTEKPFQQTVLGGWAAMVQQYFVSAWIPEKDISSLYEARKLDDGAFGVGFIEPPITVKAGSEKNIKAQLYAGPQITSILERVAPGLELTVDYGILWPICKPIFWVLKKIYDLTGNWGVAIILITVLIKLLFYRLSETSYRSMGNMKKLQPRIEALKERYGDDKQKFSQAVMELYKKEKVNPLGGCLPIVVQIPVFIALYYVLLGSVELRLAPFALWITDLSAKDPYYVLPILMGISMFAQQKLNPPPPDPMQAKVMMLMPVVFTVLFLNFPSGLVLYWLVNNILSLLQQWYITRKIERAASKGHGAK